MATNIPARMEVKQTVDYVFTACDNARKVFPIFPSETVTINHNFVDPVDYDGRELEHLALFRRVRDQIREYLRSFPRGVG